MPDEKPILKRRKSLEEIGAPSPPRADPAQAARCRRCQAELTDSDDLRRRVCAACSQPSPREPKPRRVRSYGALKLLAALFMLEAILLGLVGAGSLVMGLAALDGPARAAAVPMVIGGIAALIAALAHFGLSEAAELLLELERRTRPHD